MRDLLSKLLRLELTHIGTAAGIGAAAAAVLGGSNKIGVGLGVTAAGLLFQAWRLPCCAGCAGGASAVPVMPMAPSSSPSPRGANASFAGAGPAVGGPLAMAS